MNQPVSKKVILVIAVVLIAGVIVWLESMKVHPTSSGAAAQVIALPATATSSPSPFSTSGGTASPASVAASLAALATADQQAGYQPAIEIADPTGFINTSSSFKLANLIGKNVILLDFWTYSCINCIRTLPYVTSWYTKYKNDGLTVVGIHTPEFDFEKNIMNVQNAVTQYGITYPVVLDSNYGTWQAYNNLYWPHEYLIDMAGYIVHDQVGEGSYGETEMEIQKLLEQRAQILGENPATIPTSLVSVTPQNLNDIQSPETYFGAERNVTLMNGTPQTPGVQNLTAPAPQDTTLNDLYLDGSWNFEDQYATNQKAGAKIIFTYNASKVYFVASGAATGTVVQVLQDGVPIPASIAGSDVKNSVVTITGSRLYSIIQNPTGGQHTLELIIQSPGLEAFTFTFG